MSLTGKIKLESGIELKAAVIVVSSISDNNGSNFSFSQNLIDNAKGKHGQQKDDRPQRSAGFEAKVFFDETALRDGKPPVGPLTASGQSYFHMKPSDDVSKMELADLAYSDIKALHAGLKNIDLSDLDIV